MPIYEYECKTCKYYLDALQKMSDAPLRKCPSCGKSTLVRLVSAPRFRLKGAGWYETDFKSDQEGKRNLADHPDKDAPKEEAKPAEKAEATGETKTETKPEPKKEAAAAKAKPKAAGRAAKAPLKRKAKPPATRAKGKRR